MKKWKWIIGSLVFLAGSMFVGHSRGYAVGQRDAFEKAKYATAHIERYYLRRLREERLVWDTDKLGLVPGDTSTPDITIDADSGYDPNDLLIDIVTEDYTASYALTITTSSGKDLNMAFDGDSITITGDADLNEAAKVFFYEHIKPMADEYIKERLN